MVKKIILLVVMIIVPISFIISCAPITCTKSYTEYTYDKDGKVAKEYTETITQVPEKMPPIHLKNKDLYE
jgi:hypothetical protein